VGDELQTAVIIDYQNVHLTGAGLFEPYKPKHECLIHPLDYANHLIRARNKSQRQGRPPARLGRVLVYRGLPSAEHGP
jgi:hypothetical protein